VEAEMRLNNWNEFTQHCNAVDTRWAMIYREIKRIKLENPKFATHTLQDDLLRSIFDDQNLDDVGRELEATNTNHKNNLTVAGVKIQRVQRFLDFVEANLPSIEHAATGMPPSANDLDEILSQRFDN
jgi:hypothetical protein